MAQQPGMLEVASKGADSVYQFIERTAVPADEGVRWKSSGTAAGSICGAGAYGGVSGISFFLSDYFNSREIEKARELSLAALQWSSSAGREVQVVDLGAGRSGIGMGWLKYFESTGSAVGIDKAAKVVEVVLNGPPGAAYEHDLTGDVLATDFFRGLAGVGIFLLRFWDIAGGDRILDFLDSGVKWLTRSATRGELGCYWPIYFRQSGRPAPESGMFTGFCHGLAGIGYFLAMLCERSGSKDAEILLEEIHETLCNHEVEDENGIAWRRWIGHPDVAPCQWCHGTAGIGLFYAKAFESSARTEFLDKARSAATSTYMHGDTRSSPVQCHGLAGNAELFLELYRLTNETMWLNYASDFGTTIMKYQIRTDDGDLWQGDESGHYSPDFYCGASGVGHFFLRLAGPLQMRMPLG